MRTRLIAPVAAVLAAATVGLTAPAAGAAPTVATPAAAPAAQAGSLTQTVAATVNGTTQNLTLTITRFVNQAGQLLAVGTLQNPNGGAAIPVQIPVDTQQSTGSCQILDLVLGPLHLDLLGLVIDLNQVHLTITAQQGPGNLLGNLLCAVANLLNGPGSTTGLAALLNQLLGAL